MWKIRNSFVLALLTLLLVTTGRAQDSAEPEEPNPGGAAAPLHRHSLERDFVLNIAADQKSLWTTPKQIRLEDAHWLLPLGAFSAGLIASDTSIEKRLPTSPTLIQRSQSLSNYGVASMIGAAGTFYFWGRVTQNDHARETGLLSGEALTNVLIDTSLLQFATGRQGPLEGNGKGQFWHGGQSFPSDHAAAAWSIASVVANEYPGSLTQLLAYGTASAVTAARVVGREHFASDAVVGSALGWWMGRQVYRAHHDPALDGAEWGTFVRSSEGTKPEDMGSTYVPLDDWFYAAFDRLAALGYVQTGFAGLRPWTRMECARLMQEAGSLIEEQGLEAGEALRLYRALAQEFAPEVARWDGASNRGAEVESIYTRFTGISGTPLTDGYHFGQTITNDFGRPYGEGLNTITGFSSRAEAGPLAFYVRGEYQHAPALAPVPATVQAAIAANDQNPLVPAAAPTTTNRFELLDSYLSFGFSGFQISAGRQSLWWGPGQGGPLLWSDNAEPIEMVRLSRTFPTKLPSIFSLLGPVRTEFFFGKLEGHHFPPRPFIHGQKISFKPTPNLELGFSRTVTFAGLPQPLTWGTFLTSFFSTSTGNPNPTLKPGARLGGVDFSYHIPGLRKWLVFYTDSIIHDDPSPLADPRRAAMSPGIYMPQIPKLPKLDLRIEAVYTDPPTGRSLYGDFIYWEVVYRDLYTNNGNLLGSWIGREGKGIQAWSTYWLSPRSTVQVAYRNAHVAKDFLEGGDYQDFSARADLLVRPDVSLAGSLQYESWNFPLLSPTQNSNFTASFQVTYWPHWKIRR
jgi:membrane-associated phospholipid phosphatase